MFTTKGLTFSYSKGKVMNFPDFRCHAQEAMLVLGDSGSGKTTLLHLIAKYLNCLSGQLVLDETEYQNFKNKELQEFRAQNIGMIFQKNYFIKSLNALENLLLANEFAKKEKNKKFAIEICQNLGIESKLKKPIYKLSGGEQQRLSIARALINRPKLILADEPTANLDDTNCHKVIELLHWSAQQSNAALIIVTHDQRLTKLIQNKIFL